MRLTFHTLIVLLEICVCVVSVPVSLPCTNNKVKCGVPQIDPIMQRVVGGSEAIPGSWPWTVQLEELGDQVCGGSIIGERFIMTAAHCVLDRSINPVFWRVSAGKHRTDKSNPGAMTVKVRHILRHELYDENSDLNDIALMVLESPLNYSTLIKPLCLPPPSQGVKEGQRCVLAGWGDTNDTADGKVLNQATLPVVPHATCELPHWNGNDFFRNTTFCAGYDEGIRDACYGDSGGPLVCKVGDYWYGQGIVSWGIDCGHPYHPTVYTDVSKFIPWIKDKMLKYGACDAETPVG